MLKRVFSAMQPTGLMHIGNYIGAMKQWLELQKNNDCFFCVADLHMFTSKKLNFNHISKYSFNLVCYYLACGIDPNKSNIFLQSNVFEHINLSWLINCISSIGDLKRMTQFKSKKKDNLYCGLLTYPILMASDILIYNSDLIPVGMDQIQHLEFSKRIVKKLNFFFNFKIKFPKEIINNNCSKVMDLNFPSKKMSKSSINSENSNINLLDKNDVLKRKIFSAKTDSYKFINFNSINIGILNLINIYISLNGCSRNEVEDIFSGKDYLFLKKKLLDLVIYTLEPIRVNYNILKKEKAYIFNIINNGCFNSCRVAKSFTNFFVKFIK